MTTPPRAAAPLARLTRGDWVRVEADTGTELLAIAPRWTPAEIARTLRVAGDAEESLDNLAARGEAAVLQIRADGSARLLTDANRSFPLFWRRAGSRWEVSDDVRVLASAAGSAPRPDEAAVAQFAGGGLVLGERTLYRDVHRTPPDAVVELGLDGSSSTLRRGRLALPARGAVTEGAEAGALFRDALLEAVATLVAADPGARYLLPLSGGADSRLLAAAFVAAGARDVQCFTYGVRPTAEVEVSRKVAELLGLPWAFVPTPPEEVRSAWREPETARFLGDAYTGAALPHIQDWFALRGLAAQGLLPEDRSRAVVVPGHTAVRTLKDADLLDAPELSREDLVAAIIRRHFSQAGAPRALLRDPVLRAEVEGALDRVGYDGSPLSRARALQSVNIDGRQSTYILNSVRGYESAGLGWAMPMLDLPLHRIVADLDWRLTRDRDWYRAMTDQVFRDTAGPGAEELSFWVPTAVPEERRQQMKAALSRVGLLRLAEHAASTRTNLRHPMAFEAFAPSPARYGAAVALGTTPIGVFSRAFLEGTWNPVFDWRDPMTWGTPEIRDALDPTDG